MKILHEYCMNCKQPNETHLQESSFIENKLFKMSKFTCSSASFVSMNKKVFVLRKQETCLDDDDDENKTFMMQNFSRLSVKSQRVFFLSVPSLGR